VLCWHFTPSGVLAPWKGTRFERLGSLWLTTAVEPGADDLAALRSMQVPSLRRLTLELEDAADAQTLSALVRLPWLPQLEALELSVHSPEAVVALATLELPAVPLTIAIPAPLALSHRALLRSSRPNAVLRPVPQERRPDHSISDLEVTDSPHYAPEDFATLAPWERFDLNEHSGSGVSFKQAGIEHLFSLCRHCASSDTLCIYLRRDEMERQYERVQWIRCEYRCRECGKFTHYVDTRER
jgi:hypothetical protein